MKSKLSIKNILFLLWMIGLLLYTWIPVDKTKVVPYIQTEIIILILLLSLIWYFIKNKKLIILIIILLLLLQILTYLFIEAMRYRNW